MLYNPRVHILAFIFNATLLLIVLVCGIGLPLAGAYLLWKRTHVASRAIPVLLIAIPLACYPFLIFLGRLLLMAMFGGSFQGGFGA